MKLYCRSSDKMKKSIICEMAKRDCFFEAIYEIINNIYLENIKLPNTERNQLKKFLKVINKIHKHPKQKLTRRKLIVQSGGFLPIILPIVATLVTELITNAISKKSSSG